MTYHALTSLVDLLDRGNLDAQGVLAWAAPVPSFGSAPTSQVATVGINPSCREFVDADGLELQGARQRLPTLSSLGLRTWGHADHVALATILRACDTYFRGNPYDRWFGVLERVLSPMGATFYGEAPNACHLDLVPYATRDKWGELSPAVRAALTAQGASVLGHLIRDSSIKLILLNGRSVVRLVETSSDWVPETLDMPRWSLPRSGSRVVRGVAYRGSLRVLGGIELRHPITVLGWNHNLQSSFGVTADVIEDIGAWVSTGGRERDPGERSTGSRTRYHGA